MHLKARAPHRAARCRAAWRRVLGRVRSMLVPGRSGASTRPVSISTALGPRKSATDVVGRPRASPAMLALAARDEQRVRGQVVVGLAVRVMTSRDDEVFESLQLADRAAAVTKSHCSRPRLATGPQACRPSHDGDGRRGRTRRGRHETTLEPVALVHVVDADTPKSEGAPEVRGHPFLIDSAALALGKALTFPMAGSEAREQAGRSGSSRRTSAPPR